jgi:hypothetical protein
MITQAFTIGSEDNGTSIVNARATLSHPLADEVSVAIGSGHYARFPYSVELAFFRNGEWVTDILPEFAGCADAIAGDTRVYAYVPLIYFAQFLDNYGTGE